MVLGCTRGSDASRAENQDQLEIFRNADGSGAARGGIGGIHQGPHRRDSLYCIHAPGTVTCHASDAEGSVQCTTTHPEMIATARMVRHPNAYLSFSFDSAGSCIGIRVSISSRWSPPFYPGCGDGHVDPGEACDDGNVRAEGGCAADCSGVVALCGDGVVTPPERCDDANGIDDDYCSNDCMREGSCGDGVVQSNEVCDTAGDTGCLPGCADRRAQTFEWVYQNVFYPHCSRCHEWAESRSETYDRFVGREGGCLPAGEVWVQAGGGERAARWLLAKLGSTPPCGSTMPANPTSVLDPTDVWSSQDRVEIRRWADQGARND